MIASRGAAKVALLAEGVDRNLQALPLPLLLLVALLAEGVDRNLLEQGAAPQSTGRPPRGGRG